MRSSARRQSASAEQAPQWRLRRDAGALADLELPWRNLWERSDPPPPMLQYDWIREWWRLHAGEGQFLIVEVLEGGRIVGLAPLYLRGREPSLTGWLRTVRFLGEGEPEPQEVYSSHNGWLCGPSSRAAVSHAVAQALQRQAPVWDRVLLRNIGPDLQAAHELQRRLAPYAGTIGCTESASYQAAVMPLPDYIGRLERRSHRKELRKVDRRGAAAGTVLVRASTAPEALEMFEQLVVMHQQQWRQRGFAGACNSESFLQFHRRLIGADRNCDRTWLFGLRLDDEWLAIDYHLRAGKRLYAYLAGIDPGRGRALSAGKLILLRVIERAAQEGIELLDLLGGSDEYKRRLAGRSVPLLTLDMTSRRPGARLWTGLRQMRGHLAIKR